MFEYTRIQNQISNIKGESFEMNDKQKNEVRLLENKLKQIMNKASLL